MNASSRSQILATIAMVVFLVCGQQAQAQEKHHRTYSPKAAPQGNSDSHAANSSTAPPPNLYATQASFTQDYPIIGANSDGNNLWPCLQHYHAGNGSNPNCPTLGNPSIPFPNTGAVLGKPGYVWQLNNTLGVGNGFGCDALINGTTGPGGAQYNPCGLIATWFEDTTGDSTDDLLYRIVVRQGTTTIYDTGIVDFGPAGPTVTYPVDVVLSSDTNFGFWPGASFGPNNGNCSPNIAYPLTTPANPGFYEVAVNKTCKEPVPGSAVVTTSTALGTPAYTKVTGTECTSKGVASPCYTVHWNRKYVISQDWKIFLQ
jgi:hypothetical protein